MTFKAGTISAKKTASHNWLLSLFELAIVCINVIGLDAQLYRIANGVLVLFFAGVAYLCLKRDWKIRTGRGMLYPILVFAYMLLSCLWAYSSSTASSQFYSQLLMLVLLLAVYEACMLFPNLIYYYVHAIYISAYIMIVYALYIYGGVSGFLSTFSSIGRMGGNVNGENGFGLLFAEGCIAAFYYLLYNRRKTAWIGIALFPFFSLSSGSKKAIFLILVGLLIMLISWYGFKRIYKALS